jgi:hypothetical protein
MFRHCCVILRELVVSILPTYTIMSNAVVGNIIQIISHMFYAVEISMFKIFKILVSKHVAGMW